MDVRKKQHQPLPAAVKAAVSLVVKERGFQSDPTQVRVGYGRKPNTPQTVIAETSERKWLEAKLEDIYIQRPASITTYADSVKYLLESFKNKYKGN